MELKELVGLHQLSGVSNETKQLKSPYFDDETYDGNAFSFILDGVTYTAVEDNNDGYRSCMGEIFKDEINCKNIFEPIDVFVAHITKTGRYSEDCDILRFYDIKTSNILLEVGTDKSDDYYPSFVSDWRPDNISR